MSLKLRRQIWRFTQNQDCLAGKWAISRYGSATGDFSFKFQKSSDLILNQLHWRIGSGNRIDISSSKWALPWCGPKGLFFVSDLWNKDTGYWNPEMIRGLYGNDYLHAFSVIMPSICGLEDKVVWCGHVSGEYSVSAGYKWLFSNQNRRLDSDLMISSFPWKDFWKSKVPLRILVFGWRVIRNAVPTRDRLFRLGLTENDLCPLSSSS